MTLSMLIQLAIAILSGASAGGLKPSVVALGLSILSGIQTVYAEGSADLENAKRWIAWLQAIIQLNREVTPDEHAAARAFADAVHAYNQGDGTAPVPPPPEPPTT
jgi:hypothetical protein